MMRWWRPLLLLLLAAAIGWFLWNWLFPPPEKVIRKRLAEVAQLASFDSNEGSLAKLANAQKLVSFLTTAPDVIVNGPGQSRYEFTSHDDVFRAATAARQALHSLKIEFLDISVTLGTTGDHALVYCTATGRIGGDPNLLVQELQMTWQKVQGKWLIRRIETVKVLT